MNEAPAWGSQGRGSVRSRTDCRSHHEADMYEVSLTSPLKQEARQRDPDLTRSSDAPSQLQNGLPRSRFVTPGGGHPQLDTAQAATVALHPRERQPAQANPRRHRGIASGGHDLGRFGTRPQAAARGLSQRSDRRPLGHRRANARHRDGRIRARTRPADPLPVDPATRLRGTGIPPPPRTRRAIARDPRRTGLVLATRRPVESTSEGLRRGHQDRLMPETRNPARPPSGRLPGPLRPPNGGCEVTLQPPAPSSQDSR